MKGLLLFFLALGATLTSQAPSSAEELSSRQGEPSVFIWDAVNAITGDFFIKQKDATVIGAENLYVTRTYLSRAEENDSIWYPAKRFEAKQKGSNFDVTEPNGMVLRYWYQPETEDYRPDASQFEKGYVHRVIDEKSHFYNPLANRVIYSGNMLEVQQSNGGKRIFKRGPTEDIFLIQEERTPNGHWILYSCGQFRR